MHKFRTSIEGANLHLTLLAFAAIFLLLETKNRIWESDEKSAECGIFLEKEQERGIKDPTPSRPYNTCAWCRLAPTFLFVNQTPRGSTHTGRQD